MKKFFGLPKSKEGGTIMDIKKLLEIAVSKRASDLHLIVGVPPMLRIDGVIGPVPGETPLTPERAKELVFS